MKLLDNYERSTGVAERVTTEEQMETNLFLDAVLQTEVMKVHSSNTPFFTIHSLSSTPHLFSLSQASHTKKITYNT